MKASNRGKSKRKKLPGSWRGNVIDDEGGQSARQQLKLASCTAGRKLKSSQQMSPNKMWKTVKRKKKWIADKKVKKVPNNFKLRAGLASWLASQASWEWPSSMPIENRIFVVFFSLSTHKGGAIGRDLFMPVHDNISGNEAWLLIEVCCAMSVVRRVYVMSYPRTHTHPHTQTHTLRQHTWSVMLWLNLIELSIRLMCTIWLSDKARK